MFASPTQDRVGDHQLLRQQCELRGIILTLDGCMLQWESLRDAWHSLVRDACTQEIVPQLKTLLRLSSNLINSRDEVLGELKV